MAAQCSTMLLLKLHSHGLTSLESRLRCGPPTCSRCEGWCSQREPTVELSALGVAISICHVIARTHAVSVVFSDALHYEL
eukprot:4496400-Amphidinium_carterae.1